MQIISGKLKGRRFGSPPGGRAHPMSDRIKNALFNVLGDIENLRVLDAFGGSGALAFEAASRGAKEVTICEIDSRLAAAIKASIAELGLGKTVKLVDKSAYSWLNTNPGKYDVILIDPPFLEFKHQKFERFTGYLKDNGLMVISYPSKASDLTISGLTQIKRSEYGNAALGFYRKT
jgi:16S rRNA (guanine966-N2)-methyltransferase